MLQQARVLVNPEAGNKLTDVMEAYIRKRGEVAPKVEGRIRLETSKIPVLAKKPIILDTDMGVDSVMGLLYLLKDPSVDLKAVTICHGIADVDKGASNALKVLELAGHRAIPVAAGPAGPLRGERAFPAFWKELANTLGDTLLPEAKAALLAEPAPEVLVNQILASPEPVTVVTMGPLTNLALALRRDPSIVRNIREVVAMGGAVNGPGNVDEPFVGIRNSVAEWNLYLDPDAAATVLNSGVPLRLIPVEATRQLPVTGAFRDKVTQAKRDQTSELLLSLLGSVQEGIDGGWFFFWDTMAAVAAAHPEVMGSHEDTIRIITEEGNQLGRTEPTADGISVKVGEEVNLESFERLFLTTLLD